MLLSFLDGGSTYDTLVSIRTSTSVRPRQLGGPSVIMTSIGNILNILWCRNIRYTYKSYETLKYMNRPRIQVRVVRGSKKFCRTERYLERRVSSFRL